MGASGPVLLCAFEPFGPWERNSTEEVTAGAAKALRADGLHVERRTLPVALADALPLVASTLAELTPLAVVATGLAGKRTAVNVERVALNVADFRIPDNAGAQPRGVPLVPGAPEAWLIGFDPHALVAAVRDAGADVALSNSAGTFLCNAVYYEVLRRTRPAGIPAVFLHLPPLPGEAARAARLDEGLADPAASMPLSEQITAVSVAARHLLGVATGRDS